MDMTRMSFVSACNQYFGRKPNQTLNEFKAELDTLTVTDRQYFIREFAKVGIEVV